MKVNLAVIGVLTLVALARADEVVLTAVSGTKYGPFTFKQGERVTIAGQDFTVSLPDTARQRTIQKLRTTIIPEMEFRKADVHDVLQFLHKASVESDSGSAGAHRGVSIGLCLPTPTNLPPVPREEDIFGPSGQSTQRIEITYYASFVSAYDAMDALCLLAGLGWCIDEKGTVHFTRKEQVHRDRTPPR